MFEEATSKAVQVSRTRKEIAQLIGMVFIQKSNVNLRSTVLDTPEYFWSAPDNLQARHPCLLHAPLWPARFAVPHGAAQRHSATRVHAL